MLPYDVRQAIPTRARPAPRPRLLGDRANHPEHGSPDRADRDGASLAALGKRAEGIGWPLLRRSFRSMGFSLIRPQSHLTSTGRRSPVMTTASLRSIAFPTATTKSS